jgi:hypothetical protein
MKRLLVVGLILVVMFLAVGKASAHGRFGFFFPFPPLVIAPSPPAYYYPGYYPPPYPYYRNYRAWVPGHWDWRWTGYGWQRVWIPGYWRYGP